tara:strand:+ start:90 stop:413 length:324 start_codon:yes stop_codon:yes gene_type:complete
MSDDVEKITFYENTKTKAELKIKLYSDGLTQSSFFRSVIEAYLSEEQTFALWLEGCKENTGTLKSKSMKTKMAREKKKLNQIENKFALGEDEIENIFDILEREHPDL